MRKSGQTAETTHQGGEDHGSSESELTKECYNELVSLAKAISEWRPVIGCQEIT